jgi:hypothetical protein
VHTAASVYVRRMPASKIAQLQRLSKVVLKTA